MTEPRLLVDIRNQPQSLAAVLVYQSGPGLADLKHAAGLLRAARRVVVTGMGASFNAAAPFHHALVHAGIDAHLVENAELLHHHLPLCRDSVVLVISRSGESVEALKLQQALGVETPLIAVTNDPGSTLARSAACAVAVGSLPDEIVAVQSYTGTLLALHLLFAQLESAPATANPAALLDELPSAIARYERRSLDWQDFLEAGRPVYFLGRGPALGSAWEAALLLGETAKEPAVGLAAATFRHGPVEVVEPGFRAVLFAAEGPTRDIDLSTADALRQMGGRVVTIGADPRCSWIVPPAPPTLAPIFAIIPAQFAALRLAQWKGLEVGRFRNTGQVTRDEVAF